MNQEFYCRNEPVCMQFIVRNKTVIIMKKLVHSTKYVPLGHNNQLVYWSIKFSYGVETFKIIHNEVGKSKEIDRTL